MCKSMRPMSVKSHSVSPQNSPSRRARDSGTDSGGDGLWDRHGAVIQAALAILRSRFTQDEKTEGYRKEGPVSVAKFEIGEGEKSERREARALRQRQASDLIEQRLVRRGAGQS